MHIVTAAIREELISKFPNVSKFDVSMKEYSQWKVGGRIAAVVSPTSKLEISALIKWCNSNELPYFIIGGTTNLLFCDKDIDAIAIHVGSQFSSYTVTNNQIIAEAGFWVPRLARAAMHAGLSGIEHICGIPGNLGGLVVMNGGSQRKNIDKNIKYVETIDNKGIVKRYSQPECSFGYRSSIFQEKDEVIVEVGLLFNEVAESKAIRRELLNILKSRRKKFPRKEPNCGSVFQSRGDIYDKYGPPGKIIEDCGLKGLKKGGAQISPEHANFIVNNGNAKASDIKQLISIVRDQVRKKYGIDLDSEPKYVNEYGRIIKI
jgi:UDP-N-acetylmuramate dehydrogenase